ncbi:DUF6957 family protein [Pseudomonas sp. NPDC089396]|uniref:DUF6957 family protein n=1 Tax=Pseudomonas sp. NPDC089396 TaxID=3364461 RepID=UPI0038359536
METTDIELFSEPSERRKGASGDEAQLIELVTGRYPGKAYCLVREWTLFRAELTEAELAKVAAAGNIPLFLLAHNVVADSAGRFQPANWVRSSIGVALEDGYLFETRNTVYVLVGEGAEQKASLKTIFSFY